MTSKFARGLLAVAALFALAVSLPALAAKDHSSATVGEKAPAFSLPSVTDGEEISLADYEGQIVVMTFQSIKCPWDRMRPDGGYQRVLAPLASQYADKGVQFIAINSNKAESTEEVGSYATEHHIPYPILKDAGNKIADLYGGQTTPHFFVIDKEGVLRYKGGFEKVPTSPAKCGEMDEPYLVPVIDALLEGKEVPYTETKSKGCSIKRQ